jgi:hypothetical protein
VIQAVAHADSMARLTPAALPELVKETEKLCQADFLSDPNLQSTESAAFSSRVLEICNRH